MLDLLSVANVESPKKIRLDGHGLNHNGTTLIIPHGLPALTRLLHHVGQHEIYIRALHVDLHETSYSQTLTDFPDVELGSH